MNLAPMVDEIARAVTATVSRSLAPISRQLDELMAWRKAVGDVKDGKDGAPGEKGEAGRDAPPIDVSEVVATVLPLIKVRDGNDGKPGERGADAPPVDVDAIVAKVLPLVKVKDGEPGAIGPRGESAVLLLGEGPPLASGKSGDVYFDIVAGDVYRCT